MASLPKLRGMLRKRQMISSKRFVPGNALEIFGCLWGDGVPPVRCSACTLARETLGPHPPQVGTARGQANRRDRDISLPWRTETRA